MARLSDGNEVTHLGNVRAGARPDPVPLPTDALTDFIARAAQRNEKALALARVVMVGLAIGRHVAVHGPQTWKLDLKYVSILLALVVAFVFYGWTLLTLERSRSLSRRLRVSVVFDAAAVFAMLVISVIWTTPNHHGVLHFVEVNFLVLAAMASGLRLSRKVAWIGCVANGLALSTLVGLDLALNHAVITVHWGEYLILFVLFVGACLVAVLMSSRIRELVSDGARHAVEADRARRRMSVYLSEAVAAEALGADDLRVGGRRQEAAVLFCDLRGFTPYSESQPPEELVAELNAYLDAMMQAIRAENGVVDKFIGDAVMVVFGVPQAFGDAAPRAIRCAARMRAALAEHNAFRASEGRTSLEHGIGIHFGSVVAGNIGNAERLQYTVIGDVVNLASRLETATKEVGVPVLISAAVVDAAAGAEDGSLPPLKRHGTVRVRGREGEVAVYTLDEASEGSTAIWSPSRAPNTKTSEPKASAR